MRVATHVRQIGFAGAFAIVAMLLTTSSRGAIINEVGNAFHQYNAPSDPNVGIAINNPQNMSGGGWVGGSSGYPVGGNSPVLDGDLSTNWDAGTFSGGGMANVAVTRGYYSPDSSSFTTSPFDGIGRIRIWAAEYKNEDGSYWQALPAQVKIAYTTQANFYPGNGFNYNSGTVGQLPSPWTTDAGIFSVNGSAPMTPSNPNYSSGGWVDLTGQWTGAVQIGNYGYGSNPPRYANYVDLYVGIVPGATSIMISFGQENGSTNNPGGLDIRDIQAVVPEPAAVSFLAIGAVIAIPNRRRGARLAA